MFFDLVHYVFIIVFAVLPLMVASGSVLAAVLSAPPGRHGSMSRRCVVMGLFVSLAGALLMGLGAWLAHEDSRRGGLESLGMLLITLIGAGLLVAGLGPLPAWLLEIPGPYAERLPLPLRLAVRDLAGRRVPAAGAIALTMMVTAFGVGLTVIAVGETSQSRAEYSPRARAGTLLVRPGTFLPASFSAADAGAVRAAIERELPGVPIAQSERPSSDSWHFSASAQNVEIPEEPLYEYQAIGDEKLLRYLTGDQSTPYDEGTAVVVTSADVKVDSVDLFYEIKENADVMETKTVPAVIARTSDPHMETIFVPSAIVRDLGYQLRPDELIVDPTLRRVTVQEQNRLDDRLDDAVAEIYVERGFEASSGWVPVVVTALLVALAGALTSGFGEAANVRQGRVFLCWPPPSARSWRVNSRASLHPPWVVQAGGGGRSEAVDVAGGGAVAHAGLAADQEDGLADLTERLELAGLVDHVVAGGRAVAGAMGQAHRQDDQVDDRGGDDGGERDKARGGDRQAEHALIVAPSRRRRQRPLANCVVLARSPFDGQGEENDSGDDGYDDEGGEEQHE